jgi:hypothetical protein
MRSVFVSLLITFFTSTFFGQVSINTSGLPPDNSAMLDVASINRGFLFPRLSTSGRNSIPSPAKGLLIYNTSSKLFNYFNGSIWCQIGAFPVSSVTGTIRSGGGVSLRTVPGSVPDSSSMLDVNDATRGVLIPRTTTNLIISPAKGLIIYNLSTNYFNYYDGTSWRVLCSISTGATGASGSQSPAGIAVNTNSSVPHPSAILDISASDKGLLIPRLSKNQRDAIKPVSGLTIFNLTSGSIDFYNGSGWYQMIVNLLTSPTPATHLPEMTQITWKWNKIPGEPYYKWNTTNNYATAINLGSDTSKTETGLTCNTSYTRYVWAYNDCGASIASTLVKTTLACSNPPNDYCAEANALFARMTVQPPVERKVIIDTLIRGLKRDTIWSKLDVVYSFVAHTEQAALLNWKSTSNNASNINMVYRVDSGFMGNGSTSYINTNFNPFSQGINYTKTNASFGAYIWRNISESNGSGVWTTTGRGLLIAPRWGSVDYFIYKNQSISTPNSLNSNSSGHFTINRSNSTQVTGMWNYLYEIDTSVVCSSIPDYNIYVGAVNSSPPMWFSRNTFALAYAGKSLSYSQYLSFTDHINKFYYALGLKKVPFGIIGNSTIAARSNAFQTCYSIADLMNDSVTDKKFRITDLATSGEVIAQQKTRWVNLSAPVKRNMEYVFIEIGINDIIWNAYSAATMIAALQDLVNTISTNIGPNHKIVLSTLTPIRTYLHNNPIYQPTETAMYNVWLATNEAIMGGGATPIVRTGGGIMYRTNQHTITMDDGNGFFKPEYDCGDHLHQTCFGKQIIADEWEQIYWTNK